MARPEPIIPGAILPPSLSVFRSTHLCVCPTGLHSDHMTRFSPAHSLDHHQNLLALLPSFLQTGKASIIRVRNTRRAEPRGRGNGSSAVTRHRPYNGPQRLRMRLSAEERARATSFMIFLGGRRRGATGNKWKGVIRDEKVERHLCLLTR